MEEYPLFNDEMTFVHFYERFLDKVKNKQLHFVTRFEGGITKPKISIGGLGMFSKTMPEEDIYKCVSCGQLWNLSLPENAWRGYFICEPSDA